MEVLKVAQQPIYEAPDKALAQEWVSPRNSRVKTHSMALITIPPGVRVDPHRHLECEEVYYVLTGEGLMYWEGETQVIGPGDAVTILPGEVHSIKNESADTPLTMHVICDPAWSPEDQVFVEVEGY